MVKILLSPILGTHHLCRATFSTFTLVRAPLSNVPMSVRGQGLGRGLAYRRLQLKLQTDYPSSPDASSTYLHVTSINIKASAFDH